MKTIDIEKIINEKYPNLFINKSKIFKKTFFLLISKILRLNEINSFLEKNKYKKDFLFIDELFEHFDFTFTLSNKDLQKIPADGKLIIVANHPLGGLDGIALLKAIREVRTDVKVIVNDVLTNIENLENLFLPYKLDSDEPQLDRIKNIVNSLKNNEAIIIFPAAAVSRVHFGKITDYKWQNGPVYFAKKYNVPILPVYIDAKNSMLFYLLSFLHKGFSQALLPGELFKKRGKSITIKIGEVIPPNAFKSDYIKLDVYSKLLRKHVYKLAKNKSGVFETEKSVIHPIDKAILKKEFSNHKPLLRTNENKDIYLLDFETSPNIMKEIARLREKTFRIVGEGTGKKLDMDVYDNYYKHLVLWDYDELEIVGSYRIGNSNSIFLNEGLSGLYTTTLFNFSSEFVSKYLFNSLELGRSFIQKEYWNSSALVYLWQGIGQYILSQQNINYLIGPVSISNSYPTYHKSMLVYFYKKYFGVDDKIATAKNPFIIDEKLRREFDEYFSAATYNENFKKLKSKFKETGYSIPILFKHYTELCIEGGVKFFDFNIDENFGNCIDGLIVVDINLIKEYKKELFMNKCNSKNTEKIILEKNLKK